MINKSDDIIVMTIARLIIPFIQLYALYVLMHGHYSPGGGFQGGVILGASFILLIITHGIVEARKKISKKAITLFSSFGVFIYAGIGALCLILSGNYLDYGYLSKILHVDAAHARSLGILGVETGVGLAVMAVMVSIFINISSFGESAPENNTDEEE
ncbi:MAG: Na(+)/H(+) antiporter subunit B [Spirochaetes bacterium]|nr:Na(+)/H(+) antiporter subunit B [Spirochaetota bacterium]